MALTTSLKRVPKWAWLVGGGVLAGGVALRIIANRNEEEEAAEGADPTGTYGAYDAYTAGETIAPGAPGVIVPPVITGGDGESTQAPPPWTLPEISEFVQGILASAGPPPAPAEQAPSPIVIQVPTAPGPAAPSGAPTAKPKCTYNGHCLSWWQSAGNNRNSKGKWRWPDGEGFVHTRAFAGNKACDGGGSAGGSKRAC